MRPLEFECNIGQGFAANANASYSAQGLKGHTAIDESCGYGSDVHAYASGQVYARHTPQKPASDGYTALYQLCQTPLEWFEFSVGHLSEILPKIGDFVARGDLIGREGNKGVVYQGGVRITLEMQRNGDKRGSHRHVQKRPVNLVKEVSRFKVYLTNEFGRYRDKDGFYYEVVDYNNGFNGCVDFTKPLWTRDLYLSSTGYDVLLLQRALVLQGFADFEPTSFYGPKTMQAVMKFQAAAGLLPAAGYFGPKSRGTLNAIYKQL